MDGLLDGFDPDISQRSRPRKRQTMNDLLWLATVVEGAPSPDAQARMARGLATWWRAGGLSLPRCLGLPENPELARLRLRDYYLARAAELLHAPDDRRWSRAVALCDAARLFLARKWPCWHDLPAPPAHASALEALLFHATRAAGGALPASSRRYAQILAR